MTGLKLIGCLLVLLAGCVSSEERCSPCQTPDCAICTLGWFSSNCSSFCSENCFNGCNKTGACKGCLPNYFGPTCEKRCPGNCRASNTNEVACDQTSGQCLLGCVEGFWGSVCTDPCDPGCIGGVCIHTSRECVKGCKGGLVWDNLQRKCIFTLVLPLSEPRSCADGFYGRNCDQECSSSCKDSSCSFDPSLNLLVCNTGCVDGKTGPYCEQHCPWDCERCSQIDGCTTSSRTGCEFACQTAACLTCYDGYYGARCEKRCQKNCEGTCHKSDGSCDYACKDGFWGPYCNSSCPGNCGGAGCEQFTGKCTGGCKQGWYGVNCTTNCSIGCSPNICYQTTGECTKTCIVGYSGNMCDERCARKCKTCLRNDSSHCTNCSCTTYGTNCDNHCSSACLSTVCPVCSHSGFCLAGCMEARWGDQCEKSCPTNCEKCNRQTGQCETMSSCNATTDMLAYLPLAVTTILLVSIPLCILIMDIYKPFERLKRRLTQLFRLRGQ